MGDGQARSGRGRPRSGDVDRHLLATTLEVLRESGPGAVSIAAVASRSGTARTTIYRRYPDRTALLRAALDSVSDRGAAPAEGSVRDRVEWVLARTAEVLGEGIGLGGVAAVLTGEDPEFSEALRRSLAAGLEPVRAQAVADVASGDLHPALEPDLVLDVVLGAYLAETLLRGVPGARWHEDAAERLARVLAGR